MNKCIVKTTGSFMLLTRTGPINVGVATLVEKDSFVADRIRKGDLELIADNLPAHLDQRDLLAAGSVEALMSKLREPKAEPKLMAEAPLKAKTSKKAN